VTDIWSTTSTVLRKETRRSVGEGEGYVMPWHFDRGEESDMLDLSFLIEFNNGLEENATLSCLNERFLEERMSELDRYCPCRKVFEMAEKKSLLLASTDSARESLRCSPPDASGCGSDRRGNPAPKRCRTLSTEASACSMPSSDLG
jgi:hypothetical protein